eukprot:TRINITY_DN3227_c0_g1_i2.p1 TRINITY_DN3227_c0_g1~~TRINITY_DN3227_c0_g1_i2.p1  ORF type:complete len:155 (-),score=32.46 TRINITY_DN3227_c0_g1_i2:316-750(-)
MGEEKPFVQNLARLSMTTPGPKIINGQIVDERKDSRVVESTSATSMADTSLGNGLTMFGKKVPVLAVLLLLVGVLLILGPRATFIVFCMIAVLLALGFEPNSFSFLPSLNSFGASSSSSGQSRDSSLRSIRTIRDLPPAPAPGG